MGNHGSFAMSLKYCPKLNQHPRLLRCTQRQRMIELKKGRNVVVYNSLSHAIFGFDLGDYMHNPNAKLTTDLSYRDSRVCLSCMGAGKIIPIPHPSAEENVWGNMDKRSFSTPHGNGAVCPGCAGTGFQQHTHNRR